MRILRSLPLWPWLRMSAALLLLAMQPLSSSTAAPASLVPQESSLLLTASSQSATEGAVQLVDYKYAPAELSVAVGSTVTWSNAGDDTHNVAIVQGPELFVSPVLSPGDTVRYTFTKPGKYHYFCEWHPVMHGDITVTSPDGSAESIPRASARFFPETGKWVRGDFLEYWQGHGGLAQQGYPLSEEVVERSDTDGKFYTMQYFERAVFELHPENAGTRYEVLLSLIGNFSYRQKYTGTSSAPGQQPNTSPGSLLFRETGKRLGGPFLDYWQRNGGLAQQGLPISDELNEKSALDGKTYRVQYFERAVFEMHPENEPPYDVLLSQLGKFRFDAKALKIEKAASGVYAEGISQGPEHYPLLSGPHAAAALNVWIYQNDPKPVVGWVNELGVKWVMHQVSWYQIEPQRGVYLWEKLDKAVDALYNAGFNVILHPVHAPTWSWATDKLGYPKDPAEFGRFMSVLAQRYKGKVAAYQVWNEPNFAHETGPHASVSHYAAILKAGYTAIKAVDPKAVVISGALTGTGLNDPFVAVDDVLFLERMYAYNSGELRGYFDVLGAHPGSAANPPETMWPDNPGTAAGWTNHASFYFRRVEQLRQVMVENGDARKQIWVTEFGWSSMDPPATGFEYAGLNNEQQQADYIGRAFRMSRDKYPWMGPMMVFNLNFAMPNVALDPTEERIGWSLIRRDGTKRPSFFAVQEYALDR